MSEWLKNLVGYLMVVSIALQMLPNKKYEQYLRLFTGFLLMLLVLQPILKIGSAEAFIEERVNAFVREQEALEERIAVSGAEFEEGIRQEETLESGIEIEPVEQIRVEVQPIE